MNDKLITAFHDGCKYDNWECEDDRIQNSERVDAKSTNERTTSEDQD